jgi:hypothetical protein
MSRHLQSDLKFSMTEERKEPEYMHEAFQRLILNLLVTNEAESFTDVEKAVSLRCLKGMPNGGLSTTLSDKRSHSTLDELNEPIVRVRHFYLRMSADSSVRDRICNGRCSCLFTNSIVGRDEVKVSSYRPYVRSLAFRHDIAKDLITISDAKSIIASLVDLARIGA